MRYHTRLADRVRTAAVKAGVSTTTPLWVDVLESNLLLSTPSQSPAGEGEGEWAFSTRLGESDEVSIRARDAVVPVAYAGPILRVARVVRANSFTLRGRVVNAATAPPLPPLPTPFSVVRKGIDVSPTRSVASAAIPLVKRMAPEFVGVSASALQSTHSAGVLDGLELLRHKLGTPDSTPEELEWGQKGLVHLTKSKIGVRIETLRCLEAVRDLDPAQLASLDLLLINGPALMLAASTHVPSIGPTLASIHALRSKALSIHLPLIDTIPAPYPASQSSSLAPSSSLALTSIFTFQALQGIASLDHITPDLLSLLHHFSSTHTTTHTTHAATHTTHADADPNPPTKGVLYRQTCFLTT